MLDGAVRHQQSVLKIKILSVLRCPVDCLFREGQVCRMNAFEYSDNGSCQRRRVVKNAKRFLRPEDLSARQIPAETTRVAESLCFRQVRFSILQLLSESLLLGSIDSGANDAFQASIFDDGYTDATNVPQLAVGANDAFLNV